MYVLLWTQTQRPILYLKYLILISGASLWEIQQHVEKTFFYNIHFIVHIIVPLIPNNFVSLNTSYVAVLTCFSPLLTMSTGTTPAAARALTLYIRAPLLENAAEPFRLIPFRVLPQPEYRPAGLTGRLVYWRRDSERDGKRGEPEGEPSLNGTGI